MGGIETWQDAVEFLLAGATGLAVGTALFINPNVAVEIVEGLEKYLARKGKRGIGGVDRGVGAGGGA